MLIVNFLIGGFLLYITTILILDDDMKKVTPRAFIALGKLLELIHRSGMTKGEIRDALVKNTNSDAILMLVDVLDDLMANINKGD